MIDVKQFGALGQGGDDTAAIQAALDAVGKLGFGRVLFSESPSPYVVHKLTFPTVKYGGPFVYEFENSLIADSLILGSNSAYIGRVGSYLGRTPTFFNAPCATWLQTHSFTGAPLVDICGVENAYLQGLNIAAMGWDKGPAVHVHDNAGVGSVWTRFENCALASESGYALAVDASGPKISTGFGFVAENCSIGEARFVNTGMVTIRGGFLRKISVANAGISSCGDVLVEDVLSESLANDDFLMASSTGGIVSDITLRRVRIADTFNTWLVKHITTCNSLLNVKIEMVPDGSSGLGLIDPASSPESVCVFAEGYGAERVMNYPGPIYFAHLVGPRGPLQVYWGKAGSWSYGTPFLSIQAGPQHP